MTIDWDVVFSVWIAYVVMHVFAFIAGIIIYYAKGEYK